MFNFAVKYLRFFKAVPLLPHVFDCWYKLWITLTKPDLCDCIDDIEAEVATWKGVSIKMHQFGGVEFNYNGKEIGHIHSNGLLDILFTKKIKYELLNDGLINHHHVFNRSGWISFYIKQKADYAYAINLLSMAYERERLSINR